MLEIEKVIVHRSTVYLDLMLPATPMKKTSRHNQQSTRILLKTQFEADIFASLQARNNHPAWSSH